MSARKIATWNAYPPIPNRSHDWAAFYDGEEEAGHYGWGATEEEAIADFIENEQEWHDLRLGLVPPDRWVGILINAGETGLAAQLASEIGEAA